MKNESVLKAVLIGGGIAGALDILFASIFAAVYNGMGPLRLLQVVASGALGKAAFEGGAATAALGLVLHFLMSYAWAGIFLVAASRVQALMRHPVASGIGFGVVVFLAMRLIVLPLSAFPFPVSFKPLPAGMDLLSHVFFFGIPIAYFVCKALSKRTGG